MSSGQSHQDWVARVLRRWADLKRTEASGFADMSGLVGGVEVLVAVKSIPAARIDALIGKLAEGVLVGRAEGVGAIPMVIVAAPRLGEKSLRAAEDFMSSYAPDVGWGAMDEHGTVRLSLPAAGLDVDERGRRRSPAAARASRIAKRPFSDLNRWLAKHLLLGEEKPRTAAELAVSAETSRSKAYNFVRDFRALGYLDEHMTWADLSALLQDWMHEDRLVPAPRVFARGMFGPLGRGELGGGGRVLGGFAACEHHGLLHAPFELVEVHVRDIDVALADLGAGRCERRDADVALIVSSFPESVFRAAAGGVVDRWQAALDVVAQPARGLEQAELIRDRLLAEIVR